MDWYPKLPFGEGPRYLQIVAALRRDIAIGAVSAGQRLPTHREMANRLDLSVGTVSKAYAVAERSGLISGQVGRGTFVLPPTPELGVADPAQGRETRSVNLALNAPPSTGEEAVIAAALHEVLADPNLPQLLGYLPHQGRLDHREALSGWLAGRGLDAPAAQVHITHGAQHAISIALRLLAKPGAQVLAENLTYSGMTALAQLESYVLRGVAMDRHGLRPDALETAIRETGARVLYCTPTVQVATGMTMPAERRIEIAEVIARADGWIVEDDAYGFLVPDGPPPLATYLPDRSFYVVSLAKCLSPGLRIGALVAPPQFRDRIVNAIRSTGWMANALMAEASVRMIRDGSLAEQIEAKRAAATERVALAERILGPWVIPPGTPAFHVWLQVPAGRSTGALVAQAAQARLTLAATSPLHAAQDPWDGLRLCLGGADSLDELRDALESLRAILTESEAMALI